MKCIRMVIGSVLLLAVVTAFAVPPTASSPTAAPQSQSAPVMPCGNTQVNCPMAGQPMGRGNRGPMTNGMHPGMMGPGNPGPPGYRGNPGNMPPAAGNEVIYGSQLMTPEERAAYRAKMRAAKNDTERARIRAQHHQQMQERAKKLGKTLPPAPPSS